MGEKWDAFSEILRQQSGGVGEIIVTDNAKKLLESMAGVVFEELLAELEQSTSPKARDRIRKKIELVGGFIHKDKEVSLFSLPEERKYTEDDFPRYISLEFVRNYKKGVDF